METPKLISAELIDSYTIRLVFSDGVQSAVDFSKELEGGIFEKLKDKKYFSTFKLQPKFGTIEWDNGADFAPEFLYQVAKKNLKS